MVRNIEHQKRRFFKDMSSRGGDFFRTPAVGRGLAMGDLDEDGRPDLVFCHTNSPVALLQNVAPAAGWLGVKLVGKQRRDVVGSALVLEVGGRKLARFVKGGGSYLSAHDPRVLFGLGAASKPGRLTVKWSWGKEQTFDNLEPGSYWELHEGQPKPRRVAAPQ